ncbi:MAG: hypothetical protein KTR18_13685 [Acidiferrobacterales bacterium]|nr:hypothetical protein [Acidiferrobacterales bacterium]
MNSSMDEMPESGKAIMEAIESQLKDEDFPEVMETLQRLMDGGEDRENALRYIASAFSVEIFEALKNSNPYDEERYKRHLEMLPNLSFLDE